MNSAPAASRWFPTGAALGLALLLLALTGSSYAASRASGGFSRVRLRFDDGWRFLRDVEQPSPADGLRWSWRPASGVTLDATALPPDLEKGEWQPTERGQDVFRGRRGFVWYRAELGAKPAPPGAVLHFESVDDNAVVFLNGVRLTRHEGWNEPFDAPSGTAWKPGGPNVLILLVENTDGPGGISGAVTVEAPEAAALPREAAPGFDDSAWRTVHLPHDYVVEGKFDPKADTSHGSLPTPPAWYRKSFRLPKSYRGKSVWIDFDGVFRNSTVWLNGQRLGTHPSGYIGFRYDIGAVARFGEENVLAVRVDPRRPEGWWYEGGGIYRHVWLNAADPLHVAPWGIFTRVQSMEGEGREHPRVVMRIETEVANETSRDESCLVISRLIAPDGTEAVTQASPFSVPARSRATLVQTPAVASAELWSVENPQLYRLETTVARWDGVHRRPADRVDTNFGIRSIRFDPDRGFFLNGKPVKLKGTCNHQDHAGVGVAVPDSLFEWRIRKLKEMGSNAYRCSHNPPAPELLDACDRLGMLVMDETRHLGDATTPKTPSGAKATDLSELKSMLLRDRNHPSIIMWSMFNEEPLQGTDEGGRLFAAMRDVTLRLDPTRPVTGAMNFGWGGAVTAQTMLQGVNYSPQVYDDLHRRFPAIPVYGSETGSTVSTRGIYANDPLRGYVSAYDANYPPWAGTAEGIWKPIAERPWMAGAFVWTGFDYKGEPTPYGWPCVNSHFGILDICGFPKDNFYYYQAWWGDKPVVHLLPHWSWPGKEGQPIAVWCHSNAERVELFLNGHSLGAKEMPRYGHLEWQVPYAPGALEAKGYRAGQVIATDRVETTGAPASLRLQTDRTTLLADAEDVALVEVEVIDARGRVVPTAGNRVEFTVQGRGRIAGVGNGDPSSHEPDQAPARSAFNGRCMVLVGATDRPGSIVLAAASSGLASATLKLRSVRSGMR
jgi:beta-galactosidase